MGVRVSVCLPVDTGYLRLVGEAKRHALKNITTNFSLECEKFGILQKLNGRGERIRTSDPLLPKQVRYQTALRPEPVWMWAPGFNDTCVLMPVFSHLAARRELPVAARSENGPTQ